MTYSDEYLILVGKYPNAPGEILSSLRKHRHVEKTRRRPFSSSLSSSGTEKQYQSWISWSGVPWSFELSNGTMVLLTGDNPLKICAQTLATTF